MARENVFDTVRAILERDMPPLPAESEEERALAELVARASARDPSAFEGGLDALGEALERLAIRLGPAAEPPAARVKSPPRLAACLPPRLLRS